MTSKRQTRSNLSKPGSLLLMPAGAAVVAWLAVACGGDSDTHQEIAAAPTATVLPDSPPDEEYNYIGSPPALTVTSGETTVLAGFGSFCGQYGCADAVGYITLTEPLLVDADEISATLASGTVAEVSVTSTPTAILESDGVCGSNATPVGPACDRDDDQVSWTGPNWSPPFGLGSPLPTTGAGTAIDTDLSSLPGDTYVLHYSVIFESGDDASYDVLIEVPAR